MRDKLAEIIEANDGSLPPDEHYLATADAVIKALPGMVRPLVWVSGGDTDPELHQISECNAYFILWDFHGWDVYERKMNGRGSTGTKRIATRIGCRSVGAVATSDLAKEFANKHHAARRIMEAFGL